MLVLESPLDYRGNLLDFARVQPIMGWLCLVSYSSNAKNREDGLFARACLCQAGGKTLVQLKWLGNAQGNAPDDNRVYQFASYSVSGDKLTVRLLNTDVVNKDVASTEELAKAIAANKDKTNLFGEVTVFTKVNK